MKKLTNLAWLDLEMTGLDPNKDLILEIACIATDKELNILEEGPSLVIHQNQTILDNMDDWVKNAHSNSNLITEVLNSKITTQDAELKALEFFEKYCFIGASPLCGNSIWNDKNFLRQYMPTLNNFFNYRIIDVSSVKEIVKRWYPNDPNAKYYKKEVHRALADTKESIAELNHYRKFFFV